MIGGKRVKRSFFDVFPQLETGEELHDILMDTEVDTGSGEMDYSIY